ncbi:MAG: LL-diaminopimelate aminotransferase [Phycisphaerae bacterium]|nr:LL-diaminopimelate aminotransferase [Phycisphaerae bacterium]MCZ2400241.1 LL-diaminopimelate aminotransferase [Phycisphaerae bacterium]NUQ49697.1 LL-diaminopimelate aminotransferase [Phycisphaerae bacterium]
MTFEPAERLKALPPYLFVDIDRKRRALIEAGADVISFGVGDPDQPTHAFIIERLRQAAGNPVHHRYPHDQGWPPFRAAAARFMQRRYGVQLDENRQIHALIGTKEGLGHLPLAVVNPGRTVIVPDPGYPVYRSGTIFAGGVPWTMRLSEERGWLPDLSAIPSDVARAAVMLVINYPNNPTGAVASPAFLREALAFARQHELLLVQDAAYNEMYFDEPAPSVLAIPGAADFAVELHSLSKTFNMTGWRLGFIAGNADVIAALGKIKANMDSGQFGAIQEAGAAALEGYGRPELAASRAMYRERAQVMAAGLGEMGFRVRQPRATFYLWAGVPVGHDALGVVNKLLEEAAVVCIPGTGFGEAGEGYVRFALTVDVQRIRAALERMRKLRW